MKIRPLTVMLEISGPFQWRPRWFDAEFGTIGPRFGVTPGRFRRIVWLWFGLAWVRVDLYRYNNHIRSGATNWVDVP